MRRVTPRAAFLPARTSRSSCTISPKAGCPQYGPRSRTPSRRWRGRAHPTSSSAPSRMDAHQDHRTIAEIVPTVFRDSLYLAYEIPKWDGDLGRPSMYFPLSAEMAAPQGRAAAQVLPVAAAPRLVGRRSVLGARAARGMECRAPYAEAFTLHEVRDAVLTLRHDYGVSVLPASWL